MEKSVLLDANAMATDRAVRGNGVCVERTGPYSPDRAAFQAPFADGIEFLQPRRVNYYYAVAKQAFCLLRLMRFTRD